MRGLVWLDGFVQDEDREWKLNAIFKKRIGFEKKSLSIRNVPKKIIDAGNFYFHRIPSRTQPFACYDLRLADKLLYPQELINSISPDSVHSSNHAIYKVGPDDNPIYIPAFLLISSLFTGSKTLDKSLMWPGAVDLLGVSSINAGTIDVIGSKFMRTGDMTGRVSRLLAWLLTCEDARVAHASVLEFARQGMIDIRLPELMISGWVHGLELGKGLLAFSLNQLDIRYPLSGSEIKLSIDDKTSVVDTYKAPYLSPWGRRDRLEMGEDSQEYLCNDDYY